MYKCALTNLYLNQGRQIRRGQEAPDRVVREQAGQDLAVRDLAVPVQVGLVQVVLDQVVQRRVVLDREAVGLGQVGKDLVAREPEEAGQVSRIRYFVS